MKFQPILEGISGTAVMTFVMYVIAFSAKDRFKVVKILGTMLTFKTTPKKGLSDETSAIIVGIVAHYLVGIGFTFCYEWLWEENIVDPNYRNATWMGLINGIVGAIGWKLFFHIHPDPPQIPLRRYLAAIVLGHVFFAYGILSAYLILMNCV